MPKEISPSFIDRLCAPSCMQCRSPMTMALSPGLMRPPMSVQCAACEIARKSNKQSAPRFPASGKCRSGPRQRNCALARSHHLGVPSDGQPNLRP